ncbi:VWA domain-containing protein [Streptomyces sp. NPDC001709]
MGILTLLRNAFGRSRKGRAAEAEGADRLSNRPEPTQPTATVSDSSTPTVPEPRTSSSGEHELVSAAFNNVKVPHPSTPAEEAPKTEETPETEPEDRAEPEPEASHEPAAEEKPEAEGPAKEQAEAEAQPEPEPKGTTEPEAQQTEPEQRAEPAAEEEQAEPEKPAELDEPEEQAAPEKLAEQAEPEAEDTAAPQAADGEDAPQGPPAPDDETRTGGAGGNTTAEGEAEAELEKTAEPEAAHAEAPQAKATPATSPAKVKSRTPALATAYKAATATLRKTDLTGTRAKVYLVLDRSASMRPYYKDGSAQALADQTLALAAHLDPEATVHVVFFSTEVDGTTDLTLTPDHETKIDDVHAELGRMGRTSYHAAVEAVLTHYDKNATPDTPALVVFQTDGAPDAKTPATQSLTAAETTHPAVFFSFVAFGEHDNKAFDYLRKLKTANTSFFHAGPTPRELTDTELYEGVLTIWRP